MTVDQYGFDKIRVDAVCVREVIEVSMTVGEGRDENDPVRPVWRYFALDGSFLGERSVK